MKPDRRSVSAARTPLTPEEITQRSFSTGFRGLDPTEVRDFLVRIADDLRAARLQEDLLRSNIAEMERKLAEPPVIDEAMVTAFLGEETKKILSTAHDAAAEKIQKADEIYEAEVARAKKQSDEIRAEAENDAQQIREAAEGDADEMLATSKLRAREILEESRATGRTILQQAQHMRAEILGDLSKRRRIAYAQVEQLVAGREKLIEAYQTVRASLGSVEDAMTRAEVDARAAAQGARDSALAEPETPVDELESQLEPVVIPESVEEPIEVEFVDDEAAISEKKSNTLRILRRKNRKSHEGKKRANVQDGQSENSEEGVVVIPADEKTREQLAESQKTELREEVKAESDEEESDSPVDVDDLFARIRADRQAAVDAAETVLSETESQVAVLEREPAVVEPNPMTDTERQDYLLARDRSISDLVARFGKQVKKAMQNDQNDLLDRIRNQKGRPTVAAFPTAPDHAEIYRGAVEEIVAEGIHVGSSSVEGVAGGDAVRLATAATLDEFVDSFVLPLRRRLERAVEAAADEDDHERAALDGVSSVFRETKNNLLEVAASDALAAAFSRGSFAAFDGDAKVVWVVDHNGEPAPVCEANAAAGVVKRGEPFPNGEPAPPAHAGCRCLLVAV